MPNTREMELWRLVNKAFQNSIEKFGDIFAKDVTRDLLDNGVTVQKWIPVTERLPDTGIEVLAMLQVNKFDGQDAHNVVTALRMPSDSWLVADYQEGIEAEISGTDCEDCCYWITHWMPLPEPPKGE